MVSPSNGCRNHPSVNDHCSQIATLVQLTNTNIPYLVIVHQPKDYSIWPMPTAEEVGTSRADGIDHDYICIYEPIGPHVV